VNHIRQAAATKPGAAKRHCREWDAKKCYRFFAAIPLSFEKSITFLAFDGFRQKPS
jgi:hypothetical protein